MFFYYLPEGGRINPAVPDVSSPCLCDAGSVCGDLSNRIHVTGIFTYIYLKKQPGNISSMDPMGMLLCFKLPMLWPEHVIKTGWFQTINKTPPTMKWTLRLVESRGFSWTLELFRAWWNKLIAHGDMDVLLFCYILVSLTYYDFHFFHHTSQDTICKPIFKGKWTNHFEGLSCFLSICTYPLPFLEWANVIFGSKLIPSEFQVADPNILQIDH